MEKEKLIDLLLDYGMVWGAANDCSDKLLALFSVSKCCDTCYGELNTKVSYHPCPNCGELSK